MHSYHLVGIAGVGMNALAQALRFRGYAVSGSDRSYDACGESEILRKLRRLGIDILPQNGAGVSDKTNVVVSSAIEDDNSDLVEARRVGATVRHRADVLAELVAGRSCIAVGGTSGKSTVAGMIGWLLETLGSDPFVVNGASVLNWVDTENIGNVRKGNAGPAVVEADESDRSHLKYDMDWAIVTNISIDHFALDETRKMFEMFAAKARKGSVGVIDKPGFYDGFNPSLSSTASEFLYRGMRYRVPLIGRHNAENALVAVEMCLRLGYGANAVADALLGFKGIERRLETAGTMNGITVIDDYAHNPAKIRAAWTALASCYDRLIVIWRPHGYGPLRLMMNDLVSVICEVCRSNDEIRLLPVYDAGGTADRAVLSEDLSSQLKRNGVQAPVMKDREELIASVVSAAEPGTAIVTMGARDPDLPVLAKDILSAVGRAVKPHIS
ncbi:MAG: hypothetical protein JXN60_05575 [Lentisphaerae bacterium]|nr:hypothetical protein [Lentisphaerota bacterium]